MNLGFWVEVENDTEIVRSEEYWSNVINSDSTIV